MAELSDWSARVDVRLPFIPVDRSHPHHIFYLLAPTAECRTRLIEHLGQRGILAPFHYIPLHLSRMGRAAGGTPGQCPVTESVSERLLRLPLYYALTDEQQDEVIEAVRAFVG
jgi:dTDP-4-amino-4,6-dideoxygalactose transaminase